MTDSFFSRQTFVVEQHRKFFEMRNQYAIFDESGAKIGSIEQTKQSALALLARFGTDMDAMLPTTLELVDAAGQPVLELHKPWFKLTVTVSTPSGEQIGSIRKQMRVGKARFGITDPSGVELGEVKAQNWRAKDFTVLDQAGNEI
ncbi:MAG: phospholipid scramblase-related protein, partial [Acidimicrobiia bacterium]